MSPLDPKLLEILVCPSCRAKLQPAPAHDSLTCTGCKLSYPVRDGIPIMLIDQATKA